MNRWLKIGLVVAAAFALTIACTLVGGSVYTQDTAVQICGLLMWLGMAITGRWLEPNLIGHPAAFGWLSVAVNTLIYSVVFGLLLELLLVILRRSKSQS